MKAGIKKAIFLIFIITLIFPCVAAQINPEIDKSDSPYGLTIRLTDITPIAQNADHLFAVHVFNSSDGLPITSGISCNMHLYGPNGFHVLKQNDKTVSDGFDYEFNVSGGNFSSLGIYNVNVQCNNSFSGGFEDIPFEVTPTQSDISGEMVAVYILFLLICIAITVFSVMLTIRNPMQNDEMVETKLYETKKRSNLKFYLELMKKKLWIVGLFGIYISILLFVSFLGQLTFAIGMSELTGLIRIIFYIMAWGLIPFGLFWFVYFVLYFSKSTVDIMKYEYGGFKRIGKEIK